LNIATAILGMVLTLILGFGAGFGFSLDGDRYEDQGYAVEHLAAELETFQREYDELHTAHEREVSEWERAWEDQNAALTRAERIIRELDAQVEAHRQAMMQRGTDLRVHGTYLETY
jgi:phage shock protein A